MMKISFSILFLFALTSDLVAQTLPSMFTPPNLSKEAAVPAPIAKSADSTSTANVGTSIIPIGIGSKDSILGNRIARISATMDRIPQDHGQIWREYDISPYTKGRQFSAGTQPEQTIIDWIIRQTGQKTWHGEVFSILSANSDKLLVYHTKEVQLLIADVVDRFINPRAVTESCTVRVISLSRPDWLAKNHPNLKPLPIVSPGVQGWMMDKQATQLLLQSLGRRADFRELAPPQFLIPNGVAHNTVAKKARTFLRDVQANTAALNGYAEERATIDEGFALSLVPLSLLDGQTIDAMIKMDIVQVEKMIPMMVEVPTAANPRQRVQVETPQISCFKLDEQLRWAKNMVLMLDLGMIPLPNTQNTVENTGLFSGVRTSNGRANVLLLIENVPQSIR